MVNKQVIPNAAVWGCLLVLAILGFGIRVSAQQPQTSGKPSDGVTTSVSHESKPTADPVVSADYQVGRGDVLFVNVWKEPDASGTAVVRPDGKISLGLISDLPVDGKTPVEIQNIVTEKISPFINTPYVTVSVREIHSKKVFVLGQVGHTGSYEIPDPTTVLQILTEAGGLKPFAKQKSIYILRAENHQQKKIFFNYKDVVQGKKMEQNIVLEPGDEIVVP